MKFRLAYFAYPIDQAPAASMAYFYQFIMRVSEVVREAGLVDVAFDPGDAFRIRRGAQIGPEVERVNMFVQSGAELTIAFLPAGVPSVGVPVEIARAASRGGPVVVFTDLKSWSLAGIVDRDNVKVCGIDEDGLESAIAWLEAVDNEGISETTREADPLPVRLLGETSRMPSRGYRDDAGLDLYVAETTVIPAGDFRDVACGVAMQLPAWGWGMLTGRSSTLRKKGLLVHTGIIDCGYRGPLFAGVWNMTDRDVVVAHNERIAQLIILPNLTMDLQPEPVKELAPHARGEAGFGSTGE